MDRLFFILSGISGFLGVGIGAFGAHALKQRVPADLMLVYQTGVQYHLVHAVALGIAAAAAARWPGAATTAAGWLFVAGIILFSGSLYALAISGVRVLGAVTPLGGVCFLAGWAALVIAAMRGS